MAEIDFVKSLNMPPVEDVIKTIQTAVQIPTLSGNEKKLVVRLNKIASDLGCDKAYSDKMGNLITEVAVGSGEGPKVVLTGHLDTVSATESEWDSDTKPFSGSIKDGKIYGRGVADMKGALCAMLHAAAALKKLPKNFSGKIYVVGTVAEELFEGVAFLEALKTIRPDYIIVGEASDGKINLGQRGRAEILITVYGEPQHASTGRKVVNAIEQVAYVIDSFHRWYHSPADPVLGKRNIVPTDIKIPRGGGGGLDGRGGNSTVPNKVEITYDVRTLVGDTQETVLDLMRNNLEPTVALGRQKYPQLNDPTIEFASESITTYTGIVIKQPKFAPSWRTSNKSDIYLKAHAGIQKVGQKGLKTGAYSFCTDGSAIIKYRELFPEDKTEIIGYGPGSERAAHTINESLEIENIKKVYHGYAGIVSELLKKLEKL